MRSNEFSLIKFSANKLVEICSDFEELKKEDFEFSSRSAAEETKESEARKWLLDAWSYVRILSPMNQKECYRKLNSSIIFCSISFQIFMLKSDLFLQCFEINNELFVDIKEKDFYENVLANPVLKSNLKENVFELRVVRIQPLENNCNLLPLVSFLPNLKSLKTFCCIHNYKIKNEELLLALSDCSNLSSFDAQCSKVLFFKHILGIKFNYEDSELSVCSLLSTVKTHFNNFLSTVQQAKPYWPNLTFLANPPEMLSNYDYSNSNEIVLAMSLAIFRNMIVFGMKIEVAAYSFDEEFWRQFFKYFPKQFQHVDDESFLFYNSLGQLSKSISLNLTDQDILHRSEASSPIYDVLRLMHESSEYDLKLYIRDELFEVLFHEFFDDPVLLRMVDSFQLDYPENSYSLIRKFEHLEMVSLYLDGEMGKVQIIRFNGIIKNLLIRLATGCNNDSLNLSFFLSNFPNVENIILQALCAHHFSYSLQLDNLSEMSMLKSICFRPDPNTFIESDVKMMCEIADKAPPKTKLFYYFNTALETSDFYKLKHKNWELKYPQPLADAIFVWNTV